MSRKKISLVGQHVTKENVKKGLRVEYGDNFARNYGNQGDYSQGIIADILDHKRFGFEDDEWWVKVEWDNGEILNYPIAEGAKILKISSGKKKKSKISKFAERVKLFDAFKIVNVSEDFYDSTVQKGYVCQIVEINARSVKLYCVNETNDIWYFNLDESTIDKIKFRKYNIVSIVKKLINDLADYLETPQHSKEGIIQGIYSRFKDVREFYRHHNQTLNYRQEDKIQILCENCGISLESNIYLDTTTFEKIRLTKSCRALYYVEDGYIRDFIQNTCGFTEIKNSYKDWLFIFQQLESKTTFVNSLKQVILNSNCNENIKSFFIKGNKIDENFIDFNRQTKKIVFTPKGKSISLTNGKLSTKNRQEMSPHKFFGRFFKNVPNASEYDIKCFADEVISTYGEYKIHEIEDGKIGEFYNQLRQDGWAVGSCMRGKPINYFKIYDNNPQVFKMVVIMLNGEMVGRALKVNAKSISDDTDFVYFDRLYYKDEEVVAWFNAYCDANDIIRKARNSHDSMNYFYRKSLGGNFHHSIYVKIHDKDIDFHSLYEQMPYLDTLRYGNFGVLLNVMDVYTITDTYSEMRPRYTFSRDGGGYYGIETKNYCHYNQVWIENSVVEITEGERFLGKTVTLEHAKKTSKGYRFKY